MDTMAVQLGAASLARHPLPQWLALHVRRQLTPRRIGFGLVLLTYLALIGVVIAGWTPVDALDQKVDLLRLRHRWPEVHRFFLDYVMLGQRGPSTFVMLPLFALLAWRRRSWRPLTLLAVALFVLNLSVGVVKVATGRWGPLVTRQAHDVFAGGNIFPSGHTANAVVLYGVFAMVVARRWRAPAVVAAAWISLTVGLSTLYLDTHWLTDVLGGWLAGALVLFTLPRCERLAQLWFERGRVRLIAWRAARASKKADAGEVLRALPEGARDDLVA
jgi:membrane-associated phospholipid phosphatase